MQEIFSMGSADRPPRREGYEGVVERNFGEAGGGRRARRVDCHAMHHKLSLQHDILKLCMVLFGDGLVAT